MARAQWSIEGPEFVNCNCDYGCPCQFNALPSHGSCRAISAMQIERGHYEDVRLDGLRWALTYEWPGPIHLGNGTGQHFVDERADAAQRRALGRILAGEDTAPGATFLQVFSTTLARVLPTQYVPIEFAFDLERRTARVAIPDVLEAQGAPIRNPLSGAEHRVRVEMPDGFEYAWAEYGSGTTRARGAVALDLQDSHASFARLHLTQDGVVRS
ncbi:MAG TPA: DUF1326 domain-containing protein [Myxococcota bacterium]|nr:DUF1326 domain-containing protein [Myxococcota bacterium]